MNKVRLCRLNQVYVLSTKTKVDISKVKVEASMDDAFFNNLKAAASKSKSKSDDEKAKAKEEYSKLKAKLLDAQKTIDSQLSAAVDSVPQLSKYLKAKFSIGRNQFPHAMVF